MRMNRASRRALRGNKGKKLQQEAEQLQKRIYEERNRISTAKAFIETEGPISASNIEEAVAALNEQQIKWMKEKEELEKGNITDEQNSNSPS